METIWQLGENQRKVDEKKWNKMGEMKQTNAFIFDGAFKYF